MREIDMGLQQTRTMKAKQPKKPTGVKGSRNAAERRGSAKVGKNQTKSGYRK